MHFGGLDDDRKESTVPHITSRPQLGKHRQCGMSICTFHLGFSLGHTLFLRQDRGKLEYSPTTHTNLPEQLFRWD